mmetsp:Transcript_12476/g.52708  ORF Transcript_12476/g.52708 Transcript_12476/m.52708 type:complete len:241 (+) Transcript_12476:432-1154(+)
MGPDRVPGRRACVRTRTIRRDTPRVRRHLRVDGHRVGGRGPRALLRRRRVCVALQDLLVPHAELVSRPAERREIVHGSIRGRERARARRRRGRRALRPDVLRPGVLVRGGAFPRDGPVVSLREISHQRGRRRERVRARVRRRAAAVVPRAVLVRLRGAGGAVVGDWRTARRRLESRRDDASGRRRRRAGAVHGRSRGRRAVPRVRGVRQVTGGARRRRGHRRGVRRAVGHGGGAVGVGWE